MQVSAACFASSSLQHLQQQMGQLILSDLSRRAWSGDDMLEPSTLTEYASPWRRIFAFVADHIPNQKVCGAMTSFAGPLNRATVKNVWAAFCMTGGTIPTSWEVEYRNREQIKKFETILRLATRPRPIYTEVEKAFMVAQNLRGVNYHGKTYDRDEAIDYVKAKEDAKKKTEEEKKKRALKKDQKNQDVAKNREKGDESVSGSAAQGAHEEAKKMADEEAEKKKTDEEAKKKKAEEDLAKRKEELEERERKLDERERAMANQREKRNRDFDTDAQDESRPENKKKK
ncbi:hypothetical protein ColKHC_00805 [Colletotrichum higginsianum]|nr:hypothetical protein ColKHC_00805 [Colletotrichum higginsianum]